MMGLILTSATALRALFVSRAADVGGGGGGGGAGGVAAGSPADEKPFVVRGADKFDKKLVIGGGGGGRGGGGVPRSAHQLPASLWSDSGGDDAPSVTVDVAGAEASSDGVASSFTHVGSGASDGSGATATSSGRWQTLRRWWLLRSAVPRATITGLRTYIAGGDAACSRSEGDSTAHCNEDDVELAGRGGPKQGPAVVEV